MKKLTSNEAEWLEVFGRQNNFFESILRNFHKHDAISYDYYGFLVQHINDVEKNGDALLTIEEKQYLEENAEDYEDVKKMLIIFDKKGYLDECEYSVFLNLKLNLLEKNKDLTIQKSQTVLSSSMESLKTDSPLIIGKFSKIGMTDIGFINDEKIQLFYHYKYDGIWLVIKYFLNGKMEEAKFANDVFFNEKNKDFTCDCRISFPDPKSFFNHIFKSPQCLTAYLPELNSNLAYIISKQPELSSINKTRVESKGKKNNFIINLNPDLSAIPLRKEEASKQTPDEDDENLFS